MSTGLDIQQRGETSTQPATLTPSDAEGSASVLDLREWLAAIIVNRAFRPVFQPIVDLQDGEIVGYEALTRFGDGRSPDSVFGIAARVGLLASLEEATALEALRAAESLPSGWLSINLSVTTLLGSDAVRTAVRAAARPVVIELTERQPVDDYRAVRDAFAAMGDDARLALDDLGAGYAGMRHLLDLRPDIVKLDRWLIVGIVDDATRQALVTGLVEVVRTFGGTLLAEGVEDAAQAACLRRLGVDLGQGWVFGRPEPAVAA